MNLPVIRVLIVDDEAAIRRALRPPLTELGFQIFEASRGEEALQLLHSTQVDVVLLDINMPGIGGIETLRRIRAATPRLPVLMVTVLDGEEEKVEALELGADDYITKPFSPRELLARVQAAIRRSKRSSLRPCITFGDVQVDFACMRATRSGKPVTLTAHEFKLLRFFLDNPERVLSRDELLNEVWGYNAYPSTRTVDNQILKLRQKLEGNPANPVHFCTVHGAGYRFVQMPQS